MPQQYRITFLFLLLGALLSACGGGSSSSDAAQNNDVTFCVSERTAIRVLITGSVEETTFTNTCDFAINLGIGLLQLSEIIPLGAGESVSKLLFIGSYIACRQPSVPFDADDSIQTDLRCT